MNGNKYGYSKPYAYQSGIPSKLGEQSKFGITKPVVDVAAQAQSQPEPTLPITPEIQQKTNLIKDPEETTPESVSTDPSVADIIVTAILWQNLPLSTILCLFGLFVGLAGEYLLQGKHGIPLLSGIAYVILFSISVNFIRSVVSVQWQTRCAWVNSPSVKSIALQAEGFVMQIAALHDRYLSARDPILTLKVTLLLWGLVYLGYTLSLWRLICLGYGGAFLFGGIKTFFAPQLASTYDAFTTSVKDRVKAFGLKRGHGGLLLFFLTCVLVYMSAWSTRALIVLLGLMIVRCNLKPSEIESIANRATDTCGPFMQSGKKQIKRFSMAATEALKRSSQGSGAKDHWK